MSTYPPTLNKPSVPQSGTDHDALPTGTRFGEFEIVRVLGVGGFGIVYLARDHSLERDVALKEYMPASLAARGAGPQITVRSSSFAETYAIGLRSFINEARLLARFDHPSLVKVYRFWEDNATAYMVMPYLQGVTLRDMRRRMAHPPDEAWVKSVIMPILSALELLHREGVYHRDIAPDNILLPPDGPPVLLDFGAARRVISDRTQSLTAILKPSYAPIEQYAEMTQLRQGPWTDLYALGAVVHYLLFGAPPPPATARAVQDDADAIETRVVPGVSPRFLEAMSWMLAIRPNQRPQSGEQLRAVLDGHAEIPPRQRSGTTVPGALVRSGPAAPSASDAAGDATRVNTAYMPTFMPTAHVSPAAAPKAAAADEASAPTTFGPTTFTPATQMPTARTPPSRIDAGMNAPAASASSAPAAPAPAAPAGASTPSGAMPAAAAASGTSAAPSRSAPLAGPSPRGDPRASQPAAPSGFGPSGFTPSGFAPSSSFGANAGPASRPAARAAQAAHAAATPAPRPRTWLAVGAGGVVVAVAALAAWQYSARHGDALSVAAAASAAASAAPPAVVALPPPPAAVAPMPGLAETSTAGSTPQAPSAAAETAPRTPVAVAPAAVPPGLGAADAAGADRSSPALGAAASGARVRLAGRPVPRIEDPATATTSPTGSRSVDAAPPYAPAATAGSERERQPRPGAPAYGREPAQRAAPVVADPEPATAREACGKRSFISLMICMDERCELPRYRATEECAAILARKAERANR